MELLLHPFDRVFRNPRDCAAPSGVHSRNGAPGAVQQQDGNAIRGPDADASPDFICHERISLALAILQPTGVAHVARVNLTQGNVNGRSAQSRPESMFLPREFLERLAAVDVVAAKKQLWRRRVRPFVDASNRRDTNRALAVTLLQT